MEYVTADFFGNLIACAALVPHGIRMVSWDDIQPSVLESTQQLVIQLSSTSIMEIIGPHEHEIDKYVDPDPEEHIFDDDQLKYWNVTYRDAPMKSKEYIFAWHVITEEALKQGRLLKGGYSGD